MRADKIIALAYQIYNSRLLNQKEKAKHMYDLQKVCLDSYDAATRSDVLGYVSYLYNKILELKAADK